MLDELGAVTDRIVARIIELQPLVDEYEALRSAATQLGIDLERLAPADRARGGTRTPAAKRADGGAATRPSTGRRPRRAAKDAASRSGRRRPGGTQATGRERRERIVELIRERPGVTVPELSQELGVEPPPLYRVVRKLQEDGIVVKRGKSLRLASASA